MGRIRAVVGPEGIRVTAIVGVAMWAAAAAGCGSGGPAAERSNAPPRSARASSPGREPAKSPPVAGPVTEEDHPLKGIVRSVAPESGRVLIRHEEIPGLMKAMTMPFEPANSSILEELNPGDAVEGTLHVVKQDGAVRDYQLRDLHVTKAVPRKSVVVDLSRGKAQVRDVPERMRVGENVPDFTMTTQDDKKIKLSEMRGQVVVLTFVYTRCPMPDFCPLMDRKFSELASHLAAFPERARQVRLISVSFDPEHDTPELLRKHAASRGANPPLWTYAVASREELAKVAPRLGLIFAPDGSEIAHNLCTAVIGPDGKLARLEVGRQPNRWSTADFLKTIYALLPAGLK